MLHHVTKLLRSANNLRSCGPVLIHGSRNTGQRPPPHPSLMALELQGYTRCLECFGIKTLLFEVAWNWGCESKKLRPRQHSGDFYSLHCLQQERVALFTRLSKVAKLAKHPNLLQSQNGATRVFCYSRSAATIWFDKALIRICKTTKRIIQDLCFRTCFDFSLCSSGERVGQAPLLPSLLSGLWLHAVMSRASSVWVNHESGSLGWFLNWYY